MASSPSTLLSTDSSFAFDKALALEFKESVDNGRINIYMGEISNHWRFREVPNGGYLISIILKTLTHNFRELNPHPIQITTHFLRKSRVGPFKIEIENLKLGKNYSTASATLMQKTNFFDETSEYITCITATSIFGDLSTEAGLSPPFYNLQRVTPKSLCVPFRPKNNSIITPISQVNALYDNKFYGKKIPESSHWVSFIDGREIDLISLGLFSDLLFPSPIFNYLGSGLRNIWLATMSLEIQFKSVPRGKWIGGTFRTKSLLNGRSEIDGELYDEEGSLLCISRQMFSIQDTSSKL